MRWGDYNKEFGSWRRINIGFAYDDTARDTATADFAYAPEWLKFPACFITIYGDELGTSPYGELPPRIIGSDGRPYFIQNTYYLNLEGQATKYEGVWEASDKPSAKEALLDTGFDPDTVKHVDFIPKEDDSRYIDLQMGDYEKIGLMLQQLEAGNFRKII